MANILCFVEQEKGEPTPISLEALGQARRLGSSLGATVFAAVTLERAPGYGEDDVLAKVAAGGADKILMLVGETFSSDPLASTWESHGSAIAMAWDISQPALVLIPASGSGRELAARAAARVGAAFLHEACVEERDGELFLAEGHGKDARILPAELDFPVVATVAPGRYAAAAGDEEAEVEVLQAGGALRFIELPEARTPADLRARLETPPQLVALVVPPVLANAERCVSTGPAVVVELTTGKGPLRIALGEGAREAQADFAAEGAPEDLLGRLFAARTRGRGRSAERRR